MADIRHLLTIEAAASTVYRAITEEEGLRGWWTHETVARPEVGSIAEFNFGSRYHNKMQIVALERAAHVEWLCLEGDAEWVGTRFVFDLESQGERTVLRFCHCSWRQTTDFFASCNYQWAYYMRSPKAFCEAGIGTPHATVEP